MVIIIILIFLLVLSGLLKVSKTGRILMGIITYIMIILVCGKVTYTPDWEGYEFLIANPNRLEFLFNAISNYAVIKGYTYESVHLFYISIYTIFLLWLISIFNKNIFLVSLMYIVFVFLFYTTQIRFFMGYYAGILSLYYFLHQRKIVLSTVLFLFALLNHSSLIILLAYIPFFNIKANKLFQLASIIAVISFIIFIILDIFTPLTSVINEDIRFSGYLSIESRSSVLGGIAFILPFIIYFPFLSKYYFRVRNKVNEESEIRKIDFLYKFAIIPIAFIGLSLFIQIIGHRFIIPSILMSLLLFFQLNYYDNNKLKAKFIFFSFVVFIACYYYLLLPFITNSENNRIIIQMLKSNPIVQQLIL